MRTRTLSAVVAVSVIALMIGVTGTVAAAAARTVGVGSAAIVEGDSSTRSLKIPVTLSSPSTTPITVSYQVVAPNASSTVPAAATDFKPFSGSLKFSVNATTGLTPVMQNVAVTVLSDTVAEPTEAFVVVITAVAGDATVDTPVGVGTIFDDDVRPGLRFDVGDLSVHEGDTGNAQAATVVVTLSAPSTVATSVKFSVVAGTAVAGTDYRATASGTLTFPAGTIEKSVTVSVLPDNVWEPSETVRIQLSTPVGAVVNRGTGTLTILDDPYVGPAGGKKVTVTGDSITYVAGPTIAAGLTDTYRTWLVGLSGFTTAGITPTVNSQVFSGTQVQVINIGTNDVGAENLNWKADLDRLAAIVKPVPCVQFVNINDLIANYFATVNKGHTVTIGTQINSYLDQLVAANPNFHLIDWRSAVTPDPLALTTDGIHPNAAGSAWLAGSIRTAVDSNCAPHA